MKRKKTAKASASPSFANPEIERIEQLLRFMSEHNLEEFEYSRGDLRIRLKKPGTNVVIAAAPRPAAEIIVPSAPASPEPATAPLAEAAAGRVDVAPGSYGGGGHIQSAHYNMDAGPRVNNSLYSA